MPRIKLGDIVEIPTPVGLAYAQFTHKHKVYGALLRVFSERYDARPTDFDRILTGVRQFACFFPLQAAINQGTVTVVGNASISSEAAAFPVFRSGAVNPQLGRVRVWTLWDGERKWRVDALTAAQRAFQIRGIWNDTLLVERIVSGWRPENDSM